LLLHVLTGDYCCGGYSNDTPAGGLAAAKPWITYYANPSANGDSTGSYPSYGTPGLIAAGIPPSQVYVYVDDSRIYRGDREYSSIAPGGVNASAAALDCFGNRITVNGGTGYLSDPYQSATVLLYNNDIGVSYNYSAGYGIVFLDDINGYLYNDGGSLPCHNGSVWAQSATSSAYATMIASITLPTLSLGHGPPGYLLNVLGPIISEANGNVATLQAEIAAFTATSNIVGMDCEGCFADNTNAEIGTSSSSEIANQWVLVEDAEIALVNAHKIFWLQDQDTRSTSSASYAGRMYAFASFMLTWDPQYTVYQNAYYGYVGDGTHANSTNPQIHVFPEEALVAYNPLVSYPSTTSGIATLRDTGGAYFREYRSCYYAGLAVGPCAFVVNPDSSSHTKPALQGSYTHTMVISSQNDVLDGGTVSLTGTAAPSTIPALTGYVLLP
jgi:hypothetical protein